MNWHDDRVASSINKQALLISLYSHSAYSANTLKVIQCILIDLCEFNAHQNHL